MLFGGERDGQTLNEMWRFHFATEFWEKLSISSDSKPMPRSQTTAFIFSQFTTRGAVHYMGLPEQEYHGTQPSVAAPNSPQKPVKKLTTSFQPNTLKSFAPAREISSDNQAVDDIYEEIDDYRVDFKGTKSAKTFTFAPLDNSLDEEDEDKANLKAKEFCYDQIPRDIIRDIKRPSHFQRIDSNGLSSSKQKPGKMTQFTLSRMSQLSCSYSMFSNESSESLNTMGNTVSTTIGCQDDDATIEDSSPSSVSTTNSLKKSQSSCFSVSKDSFCKTSTNDAPKGSVTRDPASVPNLASLTLNGRRKNEPVGADSIELLDFTERVAESNSPHLERGEGNVVVTEAVIEHDSRGKILHRSDSMNTFQSYDCSSRSSTLSSNPLIGQRTKKISKQKLIKMIDKENGEKPEELASSVYLSSDEYSSLSGYESMEGSQQCSTSEVDEANGFLGRSRQKVKDDKGLMSFANPHYLCPEVKNILEKEGKGGKSIYGEKLLPKSNDLHQNFAQVLNSPAESLISDYHDFHARLNRDFVELKSSANSGIKKLASAAGRPKSSHFAHSSNIFESLSSNVSSNHYYQSVDEEESEDLIPQCANDVESEEVCMRKAVAYTPQLSRKTTVGNGAKRPLSTGSSVTSSMQKRTLPQQPLREKIGSDLSRQGDNRKQLKLLMYIVGGREASQVTLFKRPISIWRLDLTQTF